MSQTDSESEVEVPEAYDKDVDKWTTAAVRGANNWLVTLRNATDEGIKEWSDEYTEGRNGLMTYSEGLTALAITKQEVPNILDRPGWQTLRSRYYQEDLKYILNKINSDDEPNLESDPYLPDIDTQNFTVAATFSTSAILESLKAGIEFGDEIEKTEIRNALDTNLNWLLSNKVDGDAVNAPEAAGWAWIGTDSDKYDEYVEPMNYFTYSSSLVLCDLLSSRDIDVVDDIVEEHEVELKSAIEEASEFLLKQHWNKEDSCWTVPTGRGKDARGNEKLLSTCYAFIGLSYINYTLDSTDMTSDQEKRMGEGMSWALEYYERKPDIWATTVGYDCGDDELTDGSAPYVFLDSILELVNYRDELIDYVDFEKSEIKKKANEKLVPAVLDKCWAGDEDFEEKGFRHIGDANKLLDDPDGAPEENMTAIYSTGVAMETFLLNFLEGKLEKIEETEPETISQSAETDLERETTGEVRKGGEKTVNNIILDGESDSYPDEIDEQLRNIRTEVERISEEIGDSGKDLEMEEFEERSRKFVEDLTEFQSVLSEEYDDNWVDVMDTLGSSKRSMSQSMEDYEEEFKKKNTEMFVEYISELYFCPDIETYEEEVKISEDDSTVLLPPQRGVYDEVEEWDDEDFADEDARKSYVEETVDELTEEPWGGQSVGDTVREFDSRFEEEVIED